MTKSQLIAAFIRSGMTREKAVALATYLRPGETWDLDDLVQEAIDRATVNRLA